MGNSWHLPWMTLILLILRVEVGATSVTCLVRYALYGMRIIGQDELVKSMGVRENAHNSGSVTSFLFSLSWNHNRKVDH